MDMNDIQRIAKYKESLRYAWAYTDYNDWPIKYNTIMHLFAKEFSQEFLNDLTELLESGVTIQQIAKAFSNPARIYRIINTIIYGMKRNHITLNQQREYVVLLLDIVKEMKYGSEFNEFGQNIILNSNEVNSIAENVEFVKADLLSAQKLQRFCGLIWAYTEAIFFRAHDLTKEIHGPYRSDDRFSNLIIRQYLNLNKYEIWGDMQLLPCDSIFIYADYSDSIDVSIDAYNHLYLHKGNYINNLIKYYIEIDGKPTSLKDLETLVPQIVNTIESVHQRISNSNWKEIAKIYADIYWYRKKPLRDMLHRSWRVSDDITKNINCGEMNQKFLKNMTKNEIDLLISTLI